MQTLKKGKYGDEFLRLSHMLPKSRLQELFFLIATEMEYIFWDQAY